MAADNSINIPQIVAVVVVVSLAVRWYMGKSNTPTSGNASSSRFQVDTAKINAVSAIFPQLDRRSIAWDLSRNGGNVEATTARVLDGRGLDNPPPTFQPSLPPPRVAEPTTGGNTSSTTTGSKTNPSQPDLISRYGLQGRVASSGKGKEPVLSEEQEREKRKSAWSSDKAQRAEALKKRREEMILAARRKMEMKDQGAQ